MIRYGILTITLGLIFAFGSKWYPWLKYVAAVVLVGGAIVAWNRKELT